MHRAIGRTFLGLGTLAFVVTGIPLAITTPDGNMTRYGVLLPALAWPVVATIAFRAIRGRDVVRHREVDDPAVRDHVLRDHRTDGDADVLSSWPQLPIMQSQYGGDVEAAGRGSSIP